ncbi:hypothetical protein Tco_0565292 [Tanacetum coccineum]
MQKERATQEEASKAAIYEEIDNIQAMIEADEQLAARVQAEEQELYFIEEKSRLLVEMIAERKRFFAEQRAAEQRNDKDKDSEKKARGIRKKTLSRKRASEKQSEENAKRQKMEDDAEKEELRSDLDIIPGDDVAVSVESLATKYPIVDWKTLVLLEDKMYYEIIRANRSTRSYKIFTEMLDDFDRQDVLDLYRLVKERFETASPEGYDRLLWGDLITVFEPSKDDECDNHDLSRVEEKMTLKEVDGKTIQEFETKIIAKNGTITRVPGTFQDYETSEEESVERPRKRDLYGFVDHLQLQQRSHRNEFAPLRLSQLDGNMNGWLLEDEDKVERNEVDSDLESIASSKPVWEKTTKADRDRASHHCPWYSK